MTSAMRPAFLRRFGRVSARSRGVDLGDMGTALALDETFESCASGMPQQQSPPPRPVRRVSPWRVWLGRKLGS